MYDSIINQLRRRVIVLSKRHAKPLFQLRALFRLELACRPTPSERLFRYAVFLAQTERQGACYAHGIEDVDWSLIGCDTRECVSGHLALDIAILDAAFSVLDIPAAETHELNDTIAKKSSRRAGIVAEEVLRLRGNKSRPRVAVIGAIEQVISTLTAAGCTVSATDLDSSIIGHTVGGALIKDGRDSTLSSIVECDIAVISGMTLATGTLEQILMAAKGSGTRIVMIAETGAWFAPEYCTTFGVNSVIAEPFPFYIFDGPTQVRVYRRLDGA